MSSIFFSLAYVHSTHNSYFVSVRRCKKVLMMETFLSNGYQVLKWVHPPLIILIY